MIATSAHKSPEKAQDSSEQFLLTAHFEQLYETWKKGTLLSSDGDEIIRHPAYRKMIALGKSAVPFMLKKLRDEPHFLFDALTAITGEDPVLPSHAGQLKKMAGDWLKWGEKNGYAML